MPYGKGTYGSKKGRPPKRGAGATQRSGTADKKKKGKMPKIMSTRKRG